VKKIDHANINDRYWSDFVSIYRAMTSRRVFSGYSEERLSFLRQQLEKGRCVLFNSYFGANICASIFLEAYKGAVYYHSAGANEVALSCGAMAHLHFEAMKMIKQDGFKFYCLGVNISGIKDLLAGTIGSFKRRLGNERWDLLRGERILERRKYYAIVLLPKVCIALIPGLWSSAVSGRKRVLRLLRGR